MIHAWCSNKLKHKKLTFVHTSSCQLFWGLSDKCCKKESCGFGETVQNFCYFLLLGIFKFGDCSHATTELVLFFIKQCHSEFMICITRVCNFALLKNILQVFLKNTAVWLSAEYSKWSNDNKASHLRLELDWNVVHPQYDRNLSMETSRIVALYVRSGERTWVCNFNNNFTVFCSWWNKPGAWNFMCCFTNETVLCHHKEIVFFYISSMEKSRSPLLWSGWCWKECVSKTSMGMKEQCVPSQIHAQNQ